MSTKFTPGPWDIHSSDDPYLCAYIIGNSGTPILSEAGANQFFNGDEDPELEAYGEIEIAMIDLTDEPDDERIANACLIAAAPDLYEALARLRQHCPMLDHEDYDGLYQSALDRADFALNKARGES